MAAEASSRDVLFRFVILRDSPLVIFSSASKGFPLGYIGYAPETFLDRPSLYLYSPSWSVVSKAPQIAAEYQRVRALAPKAHIVALASDSEELHVLSSAGVPTIPCNHTILTDERIFRPQSWPPEQMMADAVYNARFSSWKRHHLCRNIDSLALIYFRGEPDIEDEVRKVLPHGRYVNHEAGGGHFRHLSGEEVAAYLTRCRVGLCLSAVEGAMRVCMEYLLCGLPVVTTPARGGRMRYMLEPFAKVVEPDEDAVKKAVDDLVAAQLKPMAIRRAVAHIVAFERHEFFTTLDILLKKLLGCRSGVPMDRLIGNALKFISVSAIAQRLSEIRSA